MRAPLIALLSLTIWISSLAVPVMAAAQFVVIASNTNNNQIPAGKAFASDQTLSLVAGESVTLISQNGQVIHLQGPYSGAIKTEPTNDETQAPAKDWPATLNKITKLVTKESNRTAVIGASRVIVPGSTNAPDMRDDYWFMNVDSSGDRCVRSKDVVMWRDNPDQTIKIDLRSQKAKRTGLKWEKSKYQMKLPSQFIEDGILIVMKIDKQPRRFNLHVLPIWIKEKQLGNVLLWMVNRNCTRQSQRLINTLQSANQ